MPTLATLVSDLSNGVTSKVVAGSIIPADLGPLMARFIPKPITYSALAALVSGSTLQQGQWYLITDFRLQYEQPVSEDVLTGASEPLFVLATNVNKLGSRVYSTTFPEDTIEYSIDNSNGSDRGWITRRVDKNNNEAPYDFRNVKFARYHRDVTGIATLTNGNPYSAGIILKNGGGDLLYILETTGSYDSDLDETGIILDAGDWLGNSFNGNLAGVVIATGTKVNHYTFHKLGDNSEDSASCSNCKIVDNRGVMSNIVIYTDAGGGTPKNLHFSHCLDMTFKETSTNSTFADCNSVHFGDAVSDCDFTDLNQVITHELMQSNKINYWHHIACMVQINNCRFIANEDVLWNMPCNNVEIGSVILSPSPYFKYDNTPDASVFQIATKVWRDLSPSTSTPRWIYINEAGDLTVV